MLVAFLLYLAATQPIPFSHRVHAQAKLSCITCHIGKGRQMGFPSTSLCMGCHRTVASDKPAIRKLAAARRPIGWERIYELPEFVWFSHARHKRAPCSTCHGEVARRDELQVEIQMDMKFCRACHLKTGARAKCGTCHEEK